MDRCYKPHHPDYKTYGARGIRVSDEFRNRDTFVRYVFTLPNIHRALNYRWHLDRIDNDGNYERGNLRWVSHRKNQYRRTNTVMVEWWGKTYCRMEWVRKFLPKKDWKRAYVQLRYGKSMGEVFDTLHGLDI